MKSLTSSAPAISNSPLRRTVRPPPVSMCAIQKLLRTMSRVYPLSNAQKRAPCALEKPQVTAWKVRAITRRVGVVGYRVEQLAAACDVSVDTIRYYQSKGLLPAPKREGRVAIYDREHLARVRRIRALQQKGLTLAVIKRVVEGKLKRADADLATAVAAAQIGSDEDEFLTLDEVAARSGVPSALLRAIERAGLALGRKIDGEERFTSADVALVRQALRLLEAGLPINDLLAPAAAHNAPA